MIENKNRFQHILVSFLLLQENLHQKRLIDHSSSPSYTGN